MRSTGASQGLLRYYYHNHSLIETRNGSGTVIQQHVWDSLAGHYIDSLAQTLNDTNESLDGVLEDELYALQDQQYNLLALIDDQGDIVERYEYSLYGERIVMNANYAVLSRSARGMHLGFQGLYHDTESGLIHNRLRPYAPDLHRFLTRDPHPSIYPDGLNTYAAYHVIWGGMDPWGLSFTVGGDDGGWGTYQTVGGGQGHYYAAGNGEYYHPKVIASQEDFADYAAEVAAAGGSISDDLRAEVELQPQSRFDRQMANHFAEINGDCPPYTLTVPDIARRHDDALQRHAEAADGLSGLIGDDAAKAATEGFAVAAEYDPTGALSDAAENAQILHEKGVAGAAEVTVNVTKSAVEDRVGGKLIKGAGNAATKVGQRIKGGRYGDVRKTNKGGQVHHTPASAISPYTHHTGPSIWMATVDHRRTASWGSSAAAKAYRARQADLICKGKIHEAVQMDIDDIRSKFGNKYDDHIEEMLKQFGDEF